VDACDTGSALAYSPREPKKSGSPLSTTRASGSGELPGRRATAARNAGVYPLS
jgi:hypothetical protein